MRRPSIWRWVRKGSPFTDIYVGWQRLQVNSRFAVALSRAAANAATRVLDPQRPETWEFSGFSQNGEDGIIDYLTGNLKTSNRYFLEIGASNGFENNTSYLALARRWSGIMVEANPALSDQCRFAFEKLNWGLRCIPLMVEPDNTSDILRQMQWMNPDLFSLDIDGNDYYVAKALLEVGMRPKIIVVEYNSAFGPTRSATVTYRRGFSRHRVHSSGLYYGVSITAWRTFLEGLGYSFLTVETNGVNAFFIDPHQFPEHFLATIQRAEFRENFTQPARDWEQQWAQIAHLPLVEI